MKHKIVVACTLSLQGLILVIFKREHPFVFWCGSVFLVVLYLAITAYGVFKIRWNYFIKSISSCPPSGIVLTFDDGPDPKRTPQILEILKKENVKATFFVIGKKAEEYPEILKAIEAEGHIIANHSYGHSYFIGMFGKKKLRADIEKCSATIEKITGNYPSFFRPPFGVTNPNYSTALERTGLVSVGWSGRSFDTVINNADELLNRVKKFVKPGVIFLFHDTKKVTVEMLPDFIEYCKKKGIKIVSLQMVTGKSPYEK